MAVTIAELEGLIKEVGIQHYDVQDDFIRFSMEMDCYATPDGEDVLRLVIELSEEGEYVKIFSPRAYQVQGEHADAFLRAAAIVQWKTKLLQFEWDPSDGEVRPIVEWPIEDGTLTAKQIGRCISGMMQLLDQFHPVLEVARLTGAVDFPDDREATIGRLQALIDKLKKPDEPSDDDAPPTAL